jgi:hypothetical protein
VEPSDGPADPSGWLLAVSTPPGLVLEAAFRHSHRTIPITRSGPRFRITRETGPSECMDLALVVAR